MQSLTPKSILQGQVSGVTQTLVSDNAKLEFIIENPRHVLASVYAAKEKERHAVLSALQKAVMQELEKLQITAPELFKRLHLQEIPSNFRERVEERMRYKPQATTPTLPRFFRKHYERFQNELQQLAFLIQKTTANIRSQNRTILRSIRKALQNPAYQALQFFEELPAIGFLHSLCLALYVEPAALQALHTVSDHLGFLTAQRVSTIPFHELLRHSRDIGHAHGLIKNDKTVRYAWNFLHEAWGAFLSSIHGQRLTHHLPIKKFDPHYYHENSPSGYFDEELDVEGASMCARTLFSPTPTIGNQVAPEAHAILQAMENRHFMSKEELERNPYPYLVWSYTNLQNISGRDECTRVQNLMHLETLYPLSFRGITLTQDSLFYKAGIHSRNEEKIQMSAQDREPLDEAYLNKCLQEFEDPRNLTLHNRFLADDPGYFFRDSKYVTAAQTIAKKAFDLVRGLPQIEGVDEARWHWRIKAAFRELIHLGLLRYHQATVAKELALKELPVNTILQSFVCKECIDRGGKTNSMLLWALGENTAANLKSVFACFHARAILVRKRLILPNRMEPMLALLQVLPQQKAHNFLQSIGQLFGVTLKKVHIR